MAAVDTQDTVTVDTQYTVLADLTDVQKLSERPVSFRVSAEDLCSAKVLERINCKLTKDKESMHTVKLNTVSKCG